MDQKKGRLSILKKTTRYEASPTQTFSKSSRRISFSGTKSVKEFIAGEDKATIWGTSYEEEDAIHAGAATSNGSLENSSANESKNLSMTARKNRFLGRNTVSESDKENFMIDILSDTIDLYNSQNVAYSSDNRTFSNTFDITLNSFEVKNFKFKREALANLDGEDVDNRNLSMLDISQRLEVSPNFCVIREKDRRTLGTTVETEGNEHAENGNMSQQFEDQIDHLGFDTCQVEPSPEVIQSENDKPHPNSVFDTTSNKVVTKNDENPQQKFKTLIFADEDIDIENELHPRKVLNSPQKMQIEPNSQRKAASTEEFARVSVLKSSKARGSLLFPHGEKIDIDACDKRGINPNETNVAFGHPGQHPAQNRRTIIFERGETVDVAEVSSKEPKMKGDEHVEDISMGYMDNVVDKELNDVNDSIQLEPKSFGVKRQTYVFDNQDIEVEMEAHNKFSIPRNVMHISGAQLNENEKNTQRRPAFKRRTCVFENDAINVETANKNDENSMNIVKKDLTLVTPECIEDDSLCVERDCGIDDLKLKQNTTISTSLNSKKWASLRENCSYMNMSVVDAKENSFHSENALSDLNDRKRKTIFFTNENTLNETIIPEIFTKEQDLDGNGSVINEDINLNHVSALTKSNRCTSSRQTIVFPHGDNIAVDSNKIVDTNRIIQANINSDNHARAHYRKTLIFEKGGEIDFDDIMAKKRQKSDRDFIEKYDDKQSSKLQQAKLHKNSNRTIDNQDIKIEAEQAAEVVVKMETEALRNKPQQTTTSLSRSASSDFKRNLSNILASRVDLDMSLDESFSTSSILEANENDSADKNRKQNLPRQTIVFSKDTALDITGQIAEGDSKINPMHANVDDILVNAHRSTASSCRQTLVFGQGERIDIDTNNQSEIANNPKSNADSDFLRRKSAPDRRTIIFESEQIVDIDESIGNKPIVDFGGNFDETSGYKINRSTTKTTNEPSTSFYSKEQSLKNVSCHNNRKFELNDNSFEVEMEVSRHANPSGEKQISLQSASFLNKSSVAHRSIDKMNSMRSIQKVSRALNFDCKEPGSNDPFMDISVDSCCESKLQTSIGMEAIQNGRISSNGSILNLTQKQFEQQKSVKCNTEKKTHSSAARSFSNDARKTTIFTNQPIATEGPAKPSEIQHQPVPVTECNEHMSICARDYPTTSCRQTLFFNNDENIDTDKRINTDKVMQIVDNAQAYSTSSDNKHRIKRRTVIFDNEDIEVEMETNQFKESNEKRLLDSHNSNPNHSLTTDERRSQSLKYLRIEEKQNLVLNVLERSTQGPLRSISSRKSRYDNMDISVLERERLVSLNLSDMEPILDETCKSMKEAILDGQPNAKRGNQALQRMSAHTPAQETFHANGDKHSAPEETHNGSHTSDKARFENNSFTTTDMHAKLLKKFTPESIYLSRTARCPMIAGSFHTTTSSSSFSPNTTDALCNLNPSPTAGLKCSVNKICETDESFYKHFKRDYAELTIDATRASPFGMEDDDDIEKTHIDLVDTNSIHSIPDTPEKLEACEASLAFQIIEMNDPTADLKDIPLSERLQQTLCRKCKNCQRTMLNDTTLAGFNLEEPAGMEPLNFEALNKLKGKPRVQDVLNEFKERRLSSCFNSTYEESILQPSVPSVEFLLRNYDDCYKQSLEEETQSENYVGAVYPVIPSFEFLFLNRIKTTQCAWVFNMINLPIGVLECRHRIVKSIRLMVHFKSDELYTPHCRQLDFSKVLLEKCKVYKNPSVFDKIVLNEIFLRVPGDLTAFCSSSIDLFDFLENIDNICEKSFKLAKDLLKVVYANGSSLQLDESEHCIVKKTVCTNQTSANQRRVEFRILIWNIEKMASTDILLPSRSYFNDNLKSLPAGLDFLEKFLNSPVNFLK